MTDMDKKVAELLGQKDLQLLRQQLQLEASESRVETLTKQLLVYTSYGNSPIKPCTCATAGVGCEATD